MTLVITKYDDAINNNVTFDYSKFDYAFNGDTFPADAATDLDNVLFEIGAGFSVTRQTTTEDATGKTTAISDSEFNIYAYITDITKKDRQVHEMGLAVPGNRILYLKPVYTITSAGVDTEYIVKEGDIFTDRNGYSWKVITIIHEPYINGTQIYKKAVVQSIGMEGSS